MAIQDQCNKCSKRGTVECTAPQTAYDGTSCNGYIKASINLDKHDNFADETQNCPIEEVVNVEEVTVTSDYLKENTEIHGWLNFFLFTLVVGGFISFVYPIFTFNAAEYSGSYILALTDVVTGTLLFALAIYTFYGFVKRKPNAVFLAKTYTVAIFAFSLIGLFGGEFDASGLGSLKQTIRSLVWGIIWFLYLCNSEQVEEVIPTDFRKRKPLDYYIIAAFIVLPLACIGGGICEIAYRQGHAEENFINRVQLGVDDYTDGRMIFTKPLGFTCEKKEIDNPKITLFQLEGYDNSYITMCSDYDSDMSQNNFLEYWRNWEDEDFEKYEKSSSTTRKHITKNYDTYYEKVTLVYGEQSIVWHFAMLYHQPTSKVCLVSYYRLNDGENILEDLLNSVRFE